MKTARPPKGYSPGTLADPAFTYRPSHSTNVAATIARAHRLTERRVWDVLDGKHTRAGDVRVVVV